MLFTSTVFLFLYLPIVLTLYYIVPRKLKNTLLLVASLFFYAWGEPKFLLILIFFILINYIFAILVDKYRDHTVRVKWLLALTVIVNLSMLGIFKYANFFVTNVNSLFGSSIVLNHIALPLGISFFTFQGLSYVIDVYRKDGKAQRNIINMAMYKALFPQLIAGPIVRYQTVADQITDRKETVEKFAVGTKRFIIGLAKKMILANNCGWVADQIFSMPADHLSVGLAWIGAICYSLQIYFDFSGYSDMAIGLGKMFGFDFLENFNYPYISRSATEFWRRWHISLGTWFKDYLYIPLGGNRGTTFQSYRNLFIVWLATGFWHGAAWTFIAWGLYYGVLIMLEKAFLLKVLKRIPKVFQHLYALFAVIIGWVFFRAETFGYAFGYLKSMFGANGNSLWDQQAVYYSTQYGIIILLAIIVSIPVFNLIRNFLPKGRNAGNVFSRNLIVSAGYVLIFFLSLVSVVSSTFNPFIYFRF
ncbi:membrane-bound O-acyltransferase family protein [Bacillus sp. MUM 116]|uniref:MBOAT family O-acyltransferase n=1 Tax=Bacillus sp. MUM 116 TaxID=1678002 RepID=UPI0008F5AD91|nr:MBOAT family protein [Bacillus sp. MUM 116]OIK16327.1 membrane-bound O-acyltransferase family protein [Bacillus sp. MUM 116]